MSNVSIIYFRFIIHEHFLTSYSHTGVRLYPKHCCVMQFGTGDWGKVYLNEELYFDVERIWNTDNVCLVRCKTVSR